MSSIFNTRLVYLDALFYLSLSYYAYQCDFRDDTLATPPFWPTQVSVNVTNLGICRNSSPVSPIIRAAIYHRLPFDVMTLLSKRPSTFTINDQCSPALLSVSHQIHSTAFDDDNGDSYLSVSTVYPIPDVGKYEHSMNYLSHSRVTQVIPLQPT